MNNNEIIIYQTADGRTKIDVEKAYLNTLRGMKNLTSELPASTKASFPMLEYRGVFLGFKEQNKSSSPDR
ncbi:MAG: hypothetical protein LBU65_03280 [Planctomycetaceae bacterium]|jgi:hypothetical protein|nr:hypothetical protein [Planctomycetaceae bacterium]